MTLNGVMALFCINSANSGSFRAHCVKVFVRYLISWWVLVSLCQLTSLTIHNSLYLSLPAQDLPLSQTFWPQDWLHGLYYWPFVLTISVFVFSFFITLSLFGLVPCGRLSWLFISFWAHVNIVHHIIQFGDWLRSLPQMLRRRMLRDVQHLGS